MRAATKPNGRPPKPKHIDPLLASTFSRDRVLGDIVHALAARLADRDAEVAFKTLIVLHTLIRNGGVEQVLATVAAGDCAQQLKALAGRGGSAASTRGNSSYTALVRSYATYLDDRVRAYKELHHDVIRASESDRAGAGTSNRLRKLTVDRGLLREIGITQKVGNSVLNADVSLTCSSFPAVCLLTPPQFFSEDLRDPLIIVAAQMSFKDVLAVYAGINEGVINMLEHYFEMAKTDAARALELYRRFVSQTEKVVGYLAQSRRVSASLGFQVPKLRHAPTGLATALQEYLQDPNFENNRLEYKESKRIADGGAPSQPVPTPKPTPSTKQEPTPAPAPAPKPPTDNQAVQDFFESIDTNPTQSTFAVPHDAFTDLYGGMYAQPTGMGMYDPNFGMMQAQPTGFNPFMQSMAGQPTGFMAPQSTTGQPTGFMAPQQTGMMQPAFTGAPQAVPVPAQPPQSSGLQPQQTGTFNPFRPGAVGTQLPVGAQMTGLPPQQQQIQQQVTGFAFGSTQYPLTAQATGASAGPAPAHLPPVRDGGAKSPPPARSAGAAKPLTAQKTGSRNPFAPPGGIPSPPPSKPTLPTLSELAEQGVSNKYGLGADGWEPPSSSAAPPAASSQPQRTGLQPQATGILGNVASEFTLSGQANLQQAQATGAPSGAAVGAPSLSKAMGSLTLDSSGFDNQSTGLASQSPLLTQQTGIAPQPTGSVRPFKPESSFGAALTGQPTGNPFDAGTGLGSSGLSGQAPPGLGGSSGLGAPSPVSAPPSAALGSGNLGASSTISAQPTGLGGLSSQPTGFGGSGLASQPAGPNGASSPLAPQATGVPGSSVKPFQPSSAFGQSQFQAGPLGAQPTGAQAGQTAFGTLI